MKELEVTIRVRNNRIKERRTALGFTQTQLAKAAGMNINDYRKLENMTAKPRKSPDAPWSKRAMRLANFHCCEPEELFPAATMAVKDPKAVRTVDFSEVQPLLAATQEPMMLPEWPDAEHDRSELKGQIAAVVGTLEDREAKVIRMHFGIDDGIERTLDEVAEEFGVSRERIRRIETKALRKLRHPNRSSLLRAAGLVEP